VVQVAYEGERPAPKRLRLLTQGGGGGDPLRGPMGWARQQALEALGFECERAPRELDWLLMHLAR
jgi:hypothetical protein